jgi:hypothetical protein
MKSVSRKDAKLAKKGQIIRVLKPRLKDFLGVFCAFAREIPFALSKHF